MRYNVVLWDFDGTLVDTSEGIFQSLHAAFAEIGIQAPSKAVLQKFIGPPIMHSFMQFTGMTEEDARQATVLFRANYEAEGIYRSAVYGGLVELIKRLRMSGVKIGIATLKPEKMANLLLAYFGIADLIDVCSGSVSDAVNSATKAQIIDTALERMGCADKSKVVMIGDTVYDADGARESGVDFIAAQYGFGISEEERSGMNCVCVADHAADIEAFLFSDCL